MFEMSLLLSRTLALTASIAVFAGIWSNDQPVELLARKTVPVPQGLVQAEPEWVPVTEMTPRISRVDTVSPQASSPQTSEQVALSIGIGSSVKTFTVDATELLIPEDILQSHLEQLPLGLAVGRYRIVDSLGGVGWLNVRQTGESQRGMASRQLISTSVEEQNVQFIYVSDPVLGARAATRAVR